jgi:hypothetical protein
MSECSFGPLNTGRPAPYAIDPEYADGFACDLYHHYAEPVDDREGRWNAADLRQRGHKLDEKVQHVCETCYQEILRTPICAACGCDKEEGKRNVWYCINNDCNGFLDEETTT